MVVYIEWQEPRRKWQGDDQSKVEEPRIRKTVVLLSPCDKEAVQGTHCGPKREEDPPVSPPIRHHGPQSRAQDQTKGNKQHGHRRASRQSERRKSHCQFSVVPLNSNDLI